MLFSTLTLHAPGTISVLVALVFLSVFLTTFLVYNRLQAVLACMPSALFYTHLLPSLIILFMLFTVLKNHIIIVIIIGFFCSFNAFAEFCLVFVLVDNNNNPVCCFALFFVSCLVIFSFHNHVFFCVMFTN